MNFFLPVAEEENKQELQKKKKEEMNAIFIVSVHLMRQREESVLQTDSSDDALEETFTMVDDVDNDLDNDHYDDHTTVTLPQDDDDDDSLNNKACYYCNDSSTLSCEHCERPMCSPCFWENGHTDSICREHVCSACVQFNEHMQIFTCLECFGMPY
eukprot:14768275-Ditylum_brightwellii.AAC.1